MYDSRQGGKRRGGDRAVLKILIADDHPLFREALRDFVSQFLAGCCGEVICLEAADAEELFQYVVQEDDLDLILLDLFMPGSNALTDLAALRGKAPSTPIVVVSSLADADTIRRAITCGAAGFIPKSSPKEVVFEALARVLAGGVYVPGEAAAALPGDQQDSEPLTLRQIAVLTLLTKGKSNKEIANELDISEMTVKAHMTAIMRKLGVATRAQAIVAFQRRHPAEPHPTRA